MITNFTGTGPDFPETKLMSEVDEQVKAIALRYGLTDLLDEETALQHPSGIADITMRLFGNHPTHWLMLARFVGSLNPADNGYAMWGWPKKFYTEDEVKAESQFIITFLSHPNPGGLSFESRDGSDGARMPGQ